MRNPTVTLADIRKKGGCIIARRTFTRLFGAKGKVSLKSGIKRLKSSEHIAWAISVFGRPTKQDNRIAAAIGLAYANVGPGDYYYDLLAAKLVSNDFKGYEVEYVVSGLGPRARQEALKALFA